MAETFRRSKIEKFVKMLEDELPEMQENFNNADPYRMGLYYEGILNTQKKIIQKLKREFSLKGENGK